MSVYHKNSSGESPDAWSIKWQFVSICNKEISLFAHWRSQISSISPLKKNTQISTTLQWRVGAAEEVTARGPAKLGFHQQNVDLYNNQKYSKIGYIMGDHGGTHQRTRELKKLVDERVWHAILGICSPESEHGFQQQMMGMDSTHFSCWIQKHPVHACNVVALNQKY